MFLFKKIVAPLFFPVTMVLLILILGLFLLAWSQRKKTGKVFILIGILLLGTLGYEAVSERLLKPLEYIYPPLIQPVNMEDVRWIVVLGGGHISDPRLPVTSQISDLSLIRLVEGIRLHREIPKSKLILSGGTVFDPVSEANVMAEVAVAIGVKKENLVLEEDSKDTEDQARFICGMLKQERFILVTSASHMPRSMILFKKLGMHPIPAPTEYQVKGRRWTAPKRFYPTADGLVKAERAFYEYIGLVWTKMRGIREKMWTFKFSKRVS